LRAIALAIVAFCGAWSLSAAAKTLVVGPDQEIKTLGEAARAARDGDTIDIEPIKDGWFDCANWRADGLTIEGRGEGVVIIDRTCEGKALFVTSGDDITIRNLTLQRARVLDGNGAGIRAEGKNLHVEHARFVNNEAGILAGAAAGSTITISDSEFDDNGKCDRQCVPALAVGAIALLHVERSVFTATKAGDHLQSRALRTELIGNTITDGAAGTAQYLVDLPSGGSLVMRDNVMEKGPKSLDPQAAIVIMAGARSQAVDELRFAGNHFTNDTGAGVVFVRNWTGQDAKMVNNTLDKNTTPTSQAGYYWFEAKSWLRDTADSAKESAKILVRFLRSR